MRIDETLDFLNRYNAIILGVLCYFVWKLKTNDIPHLSRRVGKIGRQVRYLYGVKSGVQLERSKRGK